MTRYSAEFLDGWSLAEKQVVVCLDLTTLRVLDAQGRELGAWPHQGLECDAMQEGVLHVTHASATHETLVVKDPELSRLLLALHGTAKKTLPGGSRTTHYVLACMGALLAIGTLIYLSIPTLSRFVAHRIPLERERMLGMQLEVLLRHTRCEDPRVETAIVALKQSVLGPEASRFDVRMVTMPEPNAFALPGGLIILTEGLTKEAQSGDEIAGVLAHEIQHVTERHVLAGFVRDMVLSGLWSITVGDYAGLLVVDPTTAYHVANLEFSRDDEAEADRGAVTRLHKAGLSHGGLSAFFERMRKRHEMEGPEWLSTHPSTEQRIADLKRIKDLAAPRTALSPEDFDVLKRGCNQE